MRCIRYLLVYFCLVTGFNCTGQIKGIVLEAEACSVGQHPIEVFSQVHTGDSIAVKGSLVVITNYYQLFEIDGDSLFVVPDMATKDLRHKPIFPRLEQILGSSSFAKTKPVSHGFESVNVIWPPDKWTYVEGEPICLMWHPLKASQQFKLTIRDLYDDEVFASAVDSGARSQILQVEGDVARAFRENGFIMLTVADDSGSADERGIFYSNHEEFTRINPCEVNTAAQAVLAAIGLEAYGATTSITRSFYERALALSEHQKVYRILSENFDKRNGDSK